MDKVKKLDSGQLNIMRLTARDVNAEGWTRVSKMLFPHIKLSIPAELMEMREEEFADDEGRLFGGYARLTDKGRSILDAAAYL